MLIIESIVWLFPPILSKKSDLHELYAPWESGKQLFQKLHVAARQQVRTMTL